MQCVAAWMVRYYFHIHYDSKIELDFIGTEFSTLDDAIADARKARLELMADEGTDRCLIEVADQNGTLVATIPPGDN
jgi:dihydroxyacetone kinase DhaKLM complex PTS-EIIA-like component DhaM